MVKVPLSELKARLSEYLRRVKGGEEVIVTERGRAIALLSPVPRTEAAEAELDALVQSGLVRPAKRRLDKRFWDVPHGRDSKRAVLETLLRERREGR